MFVVETKSTDKIRRYLDPSYLSTAMRAHYPIPTSEDSISKISGVKCFSILDVYFGDTGELSWLRKATRYNYIQHTCLKMVF